MDRMVAQVEARRSFSIFLQKNLWKLGQWCDGPPCARETWVLFFSCSFISKGVMMWVERHSNQLLHMWRYCEEWNNVGIKMFQGHVTCQWRILTPMWTHGKLAPESAAEVGSGRSQSFQECWGPRLASTEADAQRRGLGLPRAAVLPEAAGLVGQSKGVA